MNEIFLILTVLLAVVCLFIGLLLGRKRTVSNEKMTSITRILFVTSQIAALIWVSLSYVVAIWSTLYLGQTYTLSELSEPAIHTIIGVNILKVVENIFEHNNGFVYGSSDTADVTKQS